MLIFCLDYSPSPETQVMYVPTVQTATIDAMSAGDKV